MGERPSETGGQTPYNGPTPCTSTFMRQIGVLPDSIQAHTLADYLLTLKIEARVEQEPEGWAVWVCDEDRVPQARQELEEFLKEPRAPRYAAASRTADAIRRKEDEGEQDYARRQTELREMMRDQRRLSAGRYLTLAVCAVAAVVSAVTRFGENKEDPLMQALFIAPFRVFTDHGRSMIEWDELSQIAHGEVWRLLTPVFLHFTFLHLLFNVLVLNDLGGAFEERRGPWRFALFFLVVAMCSNVAQYYLGIEWINGRIVMHSNPEFGGLSGVVYGYFGYIWMKSRYDPGLEFQLSPMTVIVLLGWFFLCMTGAVGDIANVAHAIGLGMGMLIGIAPIWWRRWRTS